jgi:uncharacterized protein HemX
MRNVAILVVAICALLTAPGMVFAQSSQEPATPSDQMMQKRTMHEQMTRQMEELDARLEQKIAAMNAATGEKEQIEAIKAVINEMASQRKEMRGKMMGMHDSMPMKRRQPQE